MTEETDWRTRAIRSEMELAKFRGVARAMLEFIEDVKPLVDEAGYKFRQLRTIDEMLPIWRDHLGTLPCKSCGKPVAEIEAYDNAAHEGPWHRLCIPIKDARTLEGAFVSGNLREFLRPSVTLTPLGRQIAELGKGIFDTEKKK